MIDRALEEVWKRRESLARKCGNDPRKLVKFLQNREKKQKCKPAISRGQRARVPE